MYKWVCKVVCVKREILEREPAFKFNGKPIQSSFPISDGHRPLFRDVVNRQINNFHRRFIGREGTMISYSGLRTNLPQAKSDNKALYCCLLFICGTFDRKLL
jgi:hypothetical protein